MSRNERLVTTAESLNIEMTECINVCNMALEEETFDPDLFKETYERLTRCRKTLKSLTERASREAKKGQTIH